MKKRSNRWDNNNFRQNPHELIRMEATGDYRVEHARPHDAHMEDVGEKGRPPGEPPDVSGSWAQKVAGCNLGGRPVPEVVVDEEFVESRLSLEFPNGDDEW